jgi:hypothetical protein
VTLRHGSPDAALLWPLYRLVQAGWVDLAGLNALTVDDVMVASDALDAIEDAQPPPE